MSVFILLVASVVSLIGLLVMLLHPAGTAIVLLAVTPFDAIPWQIFGAWGNIITYIPVVLLLMLVSPGRWGEIFLGTRIQQFAAVFMLALIVPHMMSVSLLGVGVFQSYGRMATQLVLCGLFAYAFNDPKNVPVMIRVMVVSMSAWLVLSFMDFYMGIQLLPVDTGEFEGGALDVEYEKYLSGALRFSGAGVPVNRTASWQIVPTLLAVGLWMSSKKPIDRMIAAGSILVMGLAVIATASRSAALGIMVGMCIIAPMALRVKLHQLVLGLLVIGALGGAVYGASSFISADQNVQSRWESRALGASIRGRFSRVFVAMEIWADNPIFGVGVGRFKIYSDVLLSARGDEGGRGAHNSYTHVLAEYGLFGFIPFILLLGVAVRQFLIPVKRDFPDVDFWRPYFFAGFVGYSACNWFSGYHWERYYWLPIAYAVALERYATLAARMRRREHFDAMVERDEALRADAPA
jgi:hypothetical protein